MDGLITARDAHAYLFENSDITPMVIDVRTPEAFARGHLPGAVNIPIYQLASKVNTLSDDRPLIVYCNMDHLGGSRSEAAAEMLRDAGRHARVLEGGYPEWEAAGYPIDSEQYIPPPEAPAPRRRK